MNWVVTAREMQTLLVANIGLYLLLAVAWWSLAVVARLSPVASWTLAGFNLTAGAAVLLRSERGLWPDSLTLWPSDVLLLMSFALLRAAIPAIARRALAWRLGVAVLLSGSLILAVLPYEGDLRWHARLINLGLLSLVLVAAWEAHGLLRQAGLRTRAALGFSWPMFLLALLMIGRAVDSLVQPGPGLDLRTPTPLNYVSLWGTLVLALVQNANFGFLVLLRLVLRIRELAEHDPLTGVYNRLAFEARLERAYRGFTRGRDFAVVMIDMDRFKKLNDALGHAAGDAALIRLVQAVRPCLREVDQLGRVGGEEFALLLPDTDLAGAALVAERMRELVVESGFEWLGSAWPLSASFGVAAARPEDTSGEAVLARADAGLYLAKAQGRNLVQASD